MAEVQQPLPRAGLDRRTSEQHEVDDLDLDLELSSDAEAQGANGSALASAKLSSKKKEALSQVPCKFFRSNGCSAGNSCPFAHVMPGEGQGKAVCQWFLKGSCRFGHKCALAHILPGQPMSMDRKNKRAAQHQLPNASAVAHPNGQSQMRSPQEQRSSSHRQPLRHAGVRAVDMHTAVTGGLEEGEPALRNLGPTFGTQHRETADLLFGVPDDLQGTNASQGQPPMQTTSGTFLPDWRARISQQGEERDSSARRSYDSGYETLSKPVAVGSPIGTQAFGTSPFSHPGSHSVFYSNGSAGNRLESEEERPGSLSFATAREDLSAGRHTTEDGEASASGEINEEDFLPSSLSDLLTPAELQRRRRSGLSTTRTPFSSSTLTPQSMPAHTATTSSPWGAYHPRKAQHLEDDEDSLMHARQRLAQDKAAAAMAASVYLQPASSSLAMSNTSAGFLSRRMHRNVSNGGQDALQTRQMESYSPGAQAALSHAPGQSLPQGLAAGLSRLHLRTDSSINVDHGQPERLQGDSRSGLSNSIWNHTNGGVIGVHSRPGTNHDELGPTAPSSIFAQRAPIHLAMARSVGGGSVSNSLDGLHQSSLSTSINGSANVFTPYARSPALRSEGGIAIPAGANASSSGNEGATITSGSLGNNNKPHPGMHRIRNAGTATGSPLTLATTGEEVEEPMFELE